MRESRGTLDFRTEQDSVVTLGKFDGLHKGHMRLISRVLAAGKEEGLLTVIFTFDIPPGERPDGRPVRQLLTGEERSGRLRALGADFLVECPFVDGIRRMEPEQFVREILAGRLRARRIVVGEDFRFGYQRAGDPALLQRLGPKYGFSTEVIEKETENGREISSTWIREELRRGEMETVSRLLGYRYSIRGEVVHGHALGRTMGIPTINQIPEEQKLLPPFGVYVSEVRIGGSVYYGITNIGVKPTVHEQFAGVETNLFDCSEDLYGRTAEVFPLKYLRGERRFPSLSELKAQMERDEAAGRAYVGKESLAER